MSEATIALGVMTFFILVIFLTFFVWGIRTGQFKNVEEAKYIPLQDQGFERDGRQHPRGSNTPGAPSDEGKGDT